MRRRSNGEEEGTLADVGPQAGGVEDAGAASGNPDSGDGGGGGCTDGGCGRVGELSAHELAAAGVEDEAPTAVPPTTAGAATGG